MTLVQFLARFKAAGWQQERAIEQEARGLYLDELAVIPEKDLPPLWSALVQTHDGKYWPSVATILRLWKQQPEPATTPTFTIRRSASTRSAAILDEVPVSRLAELGMGLWGTWLSAHERGRLTDGQFRALLHGTVSNDAFEAHRASGYRLGLPEYQLEDCPFTITVPAASPAHSSA